MTRKLQKKKGRTKVDIKNMVWKPTFDVNLSNIDNCINFNIFSLYDVFDLTEVS